MIGIILLAMAAALVALRLYSVLGRRTGHEQQPIVKAAPGRLALPIGAERPRGEPARDAAEPGEMIGAQAVDGVRRIVAADPSFDVLRFLGGARQAYGLILDAFWKADEAELRRFADDEVVDAFRTAIAARKEAGHVLDNRLVAIERAAIERADVSGQMASVTVRFDADVAAVTRDADGNLVAGSLTDAIQTHDLWTFSRHVRADDPNWILVETDEAA